MRRVRALCMGYARVTRTACVLQVQPVPPVTARTEATKMKQSRLLESGVALGSVGRLPGIGAREVMIAYMTLDRALGRRRHHHHHLGLHLAPRPQDLEVGPQARTSRTTKAQSTGLVLKM